MTMTTPVTTGGRITCENLVKIYQVADLEVVALQGLDLEIESGELVAIVGASGSGKSTLMNILGGLDTPSAGSATVAGYDLTRMSGRQRTTYRRRAIGFVWQQTARNLVPYLSATDNVELPMVLDGVGPRDRRRRAAELLYMVGMAHRASVRADRLSGGEQQRTAIAVGLANEPPVLLADEPTGELDSEMAGQVFGTLRDVSRTLGTTVVLVTHDPQVSGQVGRTVRIRDGRTSSETLRRGAAGTAAHAAGEEFAVLDRAGRLQLPQAHIEALALERRVRLRLEDDHIGIWPDRGETPGQTPGSRPADPHR